MRLGNTLELPVFAGVRRSPWIRPTVLRLLEEWARVLDVLAAQAELSRARRYAWCEGV